MIGSDKHILTITTFKMMIYRFVKEKDMKLHIDRNYILSNEHVGMVKKNIYEISYYRLLGELCGLHKDKTYGMLGEVLRIIIFNEFILHALLDESYIKAVVKHNISLDSIAENLNNILVEYVKSSRMFISTIIVLMFKTRYDEDFITSLEKMQEIEARILNKNIMP